MPEKAIKKPDIMHAVAAAIIRGRYVILLAFLAAAVYCGLSLDRVKVSPDLTAFLPATTETRRGISVMEEEFTTYASDNIMVGNITYERASQLAEEIRAIPGVHQLTFDDTGAHYTMASALFSVTYTGGDNDKAVIAARGAIDALLSPYDTYSYSMTLEGYSDQLAQEMLGVILIAAAVIFGILLFTSRSYFEVVIFSLVFVFAALLNMGTNFWLGTISTITNSVAVILQLALAIDYAIIFSHRYQDECENYPSSRQALTEALAKSIVEISSSSLTTISGLVALMLMQFRLGYDLGVVLAKGIVCSLLTVFLLMPGLIMFFPRAIRRTAHRSLIPDIRPWGRFLTHSGFCFVWLFLLAIPGAIWCSGQAEYAFNDSSVSEIIHSDSREAMHKITDTFANSTVIAVLVPAEDFQKEAEVLRQGEALPQVRSATGLANIRLSDGYVLTDEVTSRELAQLMGIGAERAALLFQAYGLEHQQYQAFFSGTDNYRVPLIDMLLYLFQLTDKGAVTLTAQQQETLDELRPDLEMGVDQLRGTHYNRLVFTADVPVEGEESVALVEALRSIAREQYGTDDVLVIGDVTSARDLRASYTGDSLLISLLTIGFVYIILLFTFRSVVGGALLVFVIQGSIWINFSFPFLLHMTPSFVTSMIVSAIQMGATIDYAIVLMNRYLIRRKTQDKKEAMTEAVRESFPTVLTSGTIMTLAGLLIAYRVSDVYVGHIGLAVGRGACTSVILVLTVLPQLLVLFDKPIAKTTFSISPEGGSGE